MRGSTASPIVCTLLLTLSVASSASADTALFRVEQTWHNISNPAVTTSGGAGVYLVNEVRSFESIFCCVALVSSGPALASADPTFRSILLDLNSRPLSVTKLDADEARVRITGDSGSFSLLASTGYKSRLSPHWVRQDIPTSWASAFDLVLKHYPDGSWIRAHIGSKSARGMPGVLAAVSPYVRSFVIEYDPDEVVSEVSLETYRGSVIYCGRIRGTHYQSSCSMAHVVMHGEKTIRFYGLIVAHKPWQRDALLREVVSVLASIELHEP